MTLSDFATRISNPNFIRTHKSYLVNMRYIKNIDQRIITLDNDVNVSISHGKRSDVMKTYHHYLMENISYD